MGQTVFPRTQWMKMQDGVKRLTSGSCFNTSKCGCSTCEARMVAQLLVSSKVGIFPRPGTCLFAVCMFSQRVRGSHQLTDVHVQANWKL